MLDSGRIGLTLHVFDFSRLIEADHGGGTL